MTPDIDEIIHFIQNKIGNDPLLSTQPQICGPRIQHNIARLIKGDIPPPIKISGKIICEGHHRYIAGMMFGSIPDCEVWTAASSTITFDWKNVKVDIEMWSGFED